MKMVFLCRRQPELTRERYAELLLDGHVPLALRHHPTMRRYVVNVVETSVGDAPDLDSVGELWFDTIEDFRERLYDSPEGERIIARDVAGFLASADGYATLEHVQREPPRAPSRGVASPGLKLVVALERAAGLDPEGFVRHWIERHAPLVLEDATVRGYVTNVVERSLDGRSPSLDGIAELWFDSAAAFAAHTAFEGPLGRALREDLPRFLGATRAWLVRETVQR